MRRLHLGNQRGQALLIVLAFVAALLVVVWAGLYLASGAFLSQGSVRADTRNTYALDSGLAYAIEVNDSAAKGAGCINSSSSFPLAYTSGTIMVTAAITAVPGCKVNKPTYTINVTTGPGRQLNAQISSSNAGKKATWSIDWAAYQ
jgi:hypothetical protein